MTQRVGRPEGKLYSVRMVRPGSGVSIGVRIGGVPEDWSDSTDRLIPLGGEGRLAECTSWSAEVLSSLDMPLHEATKSGRAMVIALTPLVLEDTVCRGEAPIPGLGGARVVSACLDRPLRIGGWSSVKGRPSPMRSVLPTGSVLYCEVERGSRFEFQHLYKTG